MLQKTKAAYGRIDVLILNASGGMERDADPDYALRLNRDAQLNLVDNATGLMPPGARIVFVTSHQAHFHGSFPVVEAYEAVAQSKRAGEDSLRARIPELSARGIDLIVVSGDMIEGTITVLLLDRAHPGIVDARRKQIRQIPTLSEFATAVAAAAITPHPHRPHHLHRRPRLPGRCLKAEAAGHHSRSLVHPAGKDRSAEVVCEDKSWIAFFPLNPAMPGHTLVIPRTHVADLWQVGPPLGAELMAAVIRVGRAIDEALKPEGMNLITSAGETAEQTVFHLHLHDGSAMALAGSGQ